MTARRGRRVGRGRRAPRGARHRRWRGSGVAIPASAARVGEVGAARRRSVIQTPCRAGRERPIRLWSNGSSSAAVRDPSEPSAKHFCQPSRARQRVGAQRRAAPEPALDRRRDASCRSARMDAERQAPLGQRAICRERPTSDGSRDSPPGSWTATTPSGREGSSRAIGRSSRPRRARDEPVTSRAAASWSTPSGAPVGRAGSRRRPDRAGRIDAGAASAAGSPTARDGRAPTARPGGPARPLEVVGGRPAAPPIGVPAVRPRAMRRRRAAAAWRGTRCAPGPSSSVGASSRSTWSRGDRRLGQVQMRVGEPGDRHLVGLEREPPRRRPDQRRRRRRRDPAATTRPSRDARPPRPSRTPGRRRRGSRSGRSTTRSARP